MDELVKKIVNKSKQFFNVLFWRRKLCKTCVNIFSIGNFSPCYRCISGDEYVEMK